jgi:serine protease
MRIVLPLAAALLTSLPAAAQAEHLFDEAWDGRSVLKMPEKRVPGRAIVKLAGVDARALIAPGPTGATAHKALLAVQDRSGVALELVRPLQLGWGLYEVRDLAAADLKARPDEDATMSLIEVLRDDEGVEAVTADRWYRTLLTPDDPGLGDMWHLDAIGASAAWDMTTGLSSQRIGIVDTGTLRNHVDLAGKDVTGYDFISSTNAGGDGNGRDSDYQDEGDGADCGNGARDDSWHGSHVAGTVLASTDNGRGVAGLNWNAGLVTARAMGKCGGSLSDIMDGAAWLAGANVDGVPSVGDDKVSVMNLSLGGADACSSYEQDIINWIAGQGTVFVAAAGNDGGAVGSPANCSNVITVAAHGPGNDRPLTGYSSFGTSVEVVAPGGVQGSEAGVLSVMGPGDETWDWAQGTSMAAPHVTGAISLLQVFDDTLDRAALAQLFLDNAADCSGCQGKPALRVDLLLAAVSAGVGDPGQTEPTDPPQDPPADPVDPGPVDPPVSDDAYEPNDGFDQMSPVLCGQTLDGVITRENLDWHQLDVVAGTTVSITLAGGQPDLDLYLTHGPTDADILDSSRGGTGDESIETVVEAGGTLAVVIAPYQDAAGPYSLTVGCTPPAGDPGDVGGDDAVGPEPPVTEPPDETEPDLDEGNPDPADDDDARAAVAEPQADRAQLQGGCAQTSPGSTSVLVLALFVVGFATRRRRHGR